MRYHGGSVSGQQPLKEAKLWLGAPEFLIFKSNVLGSSELYFIFLLEMEMKKRISLELRNRTPEEVCSYTIIYLFIYLLRNARRRLAGSSA